MGFCKAPEYSAAIANQMFRYGSPKSPDGFEGKMNGEDNDWYATQTMACMRVKDGKIQMGAL